MHISTVTITLSEYDSIRKALTEADVIIGKLKQDIRDAQELSRNTLNEMFTVENIGDDRPTVKLHYVPGVVEIINSKLAATEDPILVPWRLDLARMDDDLDYSFIFPKLCKETDDGYITGEGDR